MICVVTKADLLQKRPSEECQRTTSLRPVRKAGSSKYDFTHVPLKRQRTSFDRQQGNQYFHVRFGYDYLHTLHVCCSSQHD